MPKIRYICLSDMHLGNTCSLLTHLDPKDLLPDPMRPSPVLGALAKCLSSLLPKKETDDENNPTLILNGDILDLAFSMENQAAMAFERFIEQILPLFRKDIFYIPGNHDHHLWETARESKYTQFILGKFGQQSFPKDQEPLPAPWHSTRMFVERKQQNLATSPLLESLFKMHGLHKGPTVVYPNFGLLSQDNRKCLVFHHGHFVESLYRFASTLRDLIFPARANPIHTWNLEEENFAWIDFIWSTLGRSGSAGRAFGVVYQIVKDHRETQKFLSACTDRLAGCSSSKWLALTRPLLRLICPYFLGKILQPEKLLKSERSSLEKRLSDDAKKGLKWYIEGPLKEQLSIELKREGTFPEVTFVFGHTHKPFQGEIDSDEYPGGVKVYNSGGWVVDTVEREPLYGGTIILVDENLELCSLRMYNESGKAKDYRVCVAEVCPHGVTPSPFSEEIRGLVGAGISPWKDFSDTVASEIDLRARYLKQTIKNAQSTKGPLRYYPP